MATPKKAPKLKGSTKVSNMSVDQARKRITDYQAKKAAGTTGGTSGGQKLSEGAIKNLAAQGVGVNAQGFGYSLPKTGAKSSPTTGKAVTSSLGMGLGITGSSFMNQRRSVGGGFGGGTGGSWGSSPFAPNTGKLSNLEFAIVPSAQRNAGLGYAGTFPTGFANSTAPTVEQKPGIMEQLTAPSKGGTVMEQLTGTGPTTPTVRNAVTTFKAPSSTTTTTTPTTEQRAAQSEAIAAMSEPMGASTVTSGGSQVSGAPSGTSGIRTGGASLVGEPTSSSQWAANLMRAQVEQGGGVSPVGDEVNLADLQKKRDETRAMLDQYGTNAVSMPEFKANIAAMIAAGAENLKRIKPGPERPVIETPEQADFIKGVDPFQQKDLMAWADDRRDQLGITDAQKERIEILNNLQAVRETYQLVIDDIKANPNLPKGLAARRLTEVFEDQKFASAELLAKLDGLDQVIQDGNDMLDFELGIQKMQDDRQEKQYQRRMDQFGFMLESGALAGFNEEEIKNWALATGIPEASIRSMRDTAVDPSADYDITYKQDERTGDYYAFYINKKDPTDTRQVLIGNAGVKAPSGSGEKDGKVATEEKDLTVSIRRDLIDTIKANPNATADQLDSVFPEVSRKLLTQYIATYGAKPEEDTRTIWDKLGDWWDKTF